MRGLFYRWEMADAAASSGIGGDGFAGRPPLVQRILAARNLSDAERVARFLDPSLHHLHPAGLLPNVDRAAARILEEIQAGRPVVIYGDYDVDGITATTILHHTIRTIRPDADVRSYVPHRLTEGYGLNVDALEQIAAEGVRLVVSVDCGITALDAAARARELGLDLIITDHHNPPGEGDPLPEAYAIVHPRLPGSEYPWGDLCGAGVAFKVAWRLATMFCGSERVTEPLRQRLIHCLALVALGTIADIVPLVDENRVLASYGLRVMRHTDCLGLNALIEASGLSDESIDAAAVGFRLAPRLNACGRMGHAREAIRMLTTADPAEAAAIARELNAKNAERQAEERRIFEQARAMAEESGMAAPDRRVIVLAHEEWHTGVIGIVCSRLVETFGRPSILLHQRDGVCQGSARSIPGYSIHAGLHAAREHLERFGGHDMAAGLALRRERLPRFIEALTEHANGHIGEDDLVPVCRIDCEADLTEFDLDTVRDVQRLGPFGRSNPVPSVLARNLRLVNPPRAIGSEGRHLMLTVTQDGVSNGRFGGFQPVLRLVGWRMGDLAEQLATGMTFDAVLRPELNSYRGRVTVQGELRDLALHHGTD